MADKKMMSITAVAIVSIVFMTVLAMCPNPYIANTIAGFIGGVGLVACWMIQWTK